MNHLCSNTDYVHTQTHPDTHWCLQERKHKQIFNSQRTERTFFTSFIEKEPNLLCQSSLSALFKCYSLHLYYAPLMNGPPPPSLHSILIISFIHFIITTTSICGVIYLTAALPSQQSPCRISLDSVLTHHHHHHHLHELHSLVSPDWNGVVYISAIFCKQSPLKS